MAAYKKRMTAVFLIMAAVFILAAGDDGTARLASLQKVNLIIGDAVLHAWVVSRPAEMQKGLMQIKSLPPDAGMLFVFQDTAIHSFWMKNTLIPLDIAFLAEDGMILEIRKMRPLDETSIVSAKPAAFALEVSSGWFAEKKVFSGMRVKIPSDIQR